MVLVPMNKALEPRDTGVPPIEVPGALRVSVASPMMTCVGKMVTVTAPGAIVGEFVSVARVAGKKIDRGMRCFIVRLDEDCKLKLRENDIDSRQFVRLRGKGVILVINRLDE